MLASDPSDGVRLEYVKRRRVLRLWTNERAGEPIEVQRDAVLEALGDDPETAGGAARYLLLAGVASGPSGTGDARPLVVAFEFEDQARAAFRTLRLRANPRATWAQVVSITTKGRPQPVCWFGTAPVSDLDGRSIAGRQSVTPAYVPASAPGTRTSGVKPAVRRWRTWLRRPQEQSVPPGSPDSVSRPAAP